MTELPVAIGILINTYKKVKALADKADNIELKNHILEMNEQLLNMKEAVLELREENTNLKEENRKLKAVQDGELEFRNNAYYDKGGNVPYCSGCYASKNIKVPLVDMEMEFSRFGNKKCPTCKVSYSIDD